MQQLREIIATHPDVRGSDNEALLQCIEDCHACVQACTACADACLAEESVHDLVQCIRLNLDCADVCITTATLATRRSGSNEPVLRGMLEVCARACGMCAEKCEEHADHMEHCQFCAEECRRCEEQCRAALGGLSRRRTLRH